MRILTCIGDATALDTWSSTPYHFLRAGQNAGFLDKGWRLSPERLQLHRLAWNAWRHFRHREPGGFQYSSFFLRTLLKQAGPIDKSIEVISHFPLFPPAAGKSARTSFYIDATLLQNFEDYGLDGPGGVGRKMAADAKTREREQYQDAKYVVCMSRWAARAVVERYEIDPSKVHIVPAGSNIDCEAIDPPCFHTQRSLRPLKLGFLGKDWRRKNLPFVLAVADVLQSRGVKVEVTAAGFDPMRGPRHPLLRSLGYIDKHSDVRRFVAFIRACHFTCLFSVAEAFGISNRESLRLGVPVLARDVGGIPDTVPEGCGHLFAPDASADEVADILQNYVRETERYDTLCRHVAARAQEFTWDAAVAKMTAIWSESAQHAYAPASSGDACG
jgi:glycosyltransferase involved in cell wall biosynthesis